MEKVKHNNEKQSGHEMNCERKNERSEEKTSQLITFILLFTFLP